MLRRAFNDGSPVHLAPVLGLVDVGGQTAQRRRPDGALPAPQAGTDALADYAGTFSLEEKRLSLPTARGNEPLGLRLTRAVPYEAESVRSVTLLAEGRRLYVDVCAEVPLGTYEEGAAPDPRKVAGVDLGIIHPYVLADPERALVVSGRAMRAESRLHLAESKARKRATSRRAPARGRTRFASLAQVPGAHQGPRGPSPAASRPGPLRGGPRGGDPCQGAAHRHLGGGGPERTAGAGRRCAPEPRGARLEGGSAHLGAQRPGGGGRHRRGPRRRARHLVDLPVLRRARPKAQGTWFCLPKLCTPGPPRRGGRGQHRLEISSGWHRHRPVPVGDHAPSSRSASAWPCPA